MATRKINRKKNVTQRNKYKRGNRLLNRQKKIIKQSKNKKPVKKKETFKIIKCPKCKGVKQLKISKKKIDKLRNAGLLTDDIYKALTGYFCCGNIFGTSSEEYDQRDLYRGLEARRQNIINLRNRRLSSSSVVSNNNSSSYRTANEGSSSTPPPPPFVKKGTFEIPDISSSELKKQLEKEAEDRRKYNKKISAVKGEGSLQL